MPRIYSNEKKKSIHVSLPLSLHEAFYRRYPNHGERSAVLRRMIKVAVREDSVGRGLENSLRKETVYAEAIQGDRPSPE